MSVTTSTNGRNLNILIWLPPILLASVVFAASFSPIAAANKTLSGIAAVLSIVAPIGGFWAVYCCIRYEKNPLKYILIVVFVPMAFVWYYVERYRRSERGWRTQSESPKNE